MGLRRKGAMIFALTFIMLITPFVSSATASTIVINPDKTISIDGKKSFIIGTSGILDYTYTIGMQSAWPIHVNANSNALLDIEGGPTAHYTSILMPGLNTKNIFFTYPATLGTIDSTIKNNKGFFGYLMPDEPTVGAGRYKNMTEAQMLADLLNRYNNEHNSDPAHPVILNHWTDMTKWLNYGDIMMWDTYTIRYNSWVTWARADSIYAWELQSWDAYFKGTELNKISKPVGTYIQANAPDDPAWCAYEPTPAEIRANTYAAITLDVKGIIYYGYLVGGTYDGNPNHSMGYYRDSKLGAYVNQLMGEIRGLNDILVLPTTDYRWHYHESSNVLFSKKITKKIIGKDTTNFNWILKKDNATNTTYLIVLNKDSGAITDVKVTVAGLTGSGTMAAETLGLETTGSQRAGRTLTVTKGVFTDSFDGYAAHIYKIHNPDITALSVK